MAPAQEPDEDAELMLRACGGDDGAFVELVERWKQPVLAFVARQLNDETEAEDVAQGVFVQLWKVAPRYRRSARFSTFLFTIARNLTLNELRRRGRHPAEPFIPEDGDEAGVEQRRERTAGEGGTADENLLRSELEERVEAALASLPDAQRVALSLCRDGELSYEEIAEVLGTTVSSTKSLIFRARESLRARLKRYLRSGEWEGLE